MCITRQLANILLGKICIVLSINYQLFTAYSIIAHKTDSVHILTGN